MEKNILLEQLEQKLFFLKAPTGAGKTYFMANAAISLAIRGDLPILAFHTKNLVNQTEDLVLDLLKKQNIQNIDVVVHTQNSFLPPVLIFEKLIKRNVIFITVHNYLQSSGDSFVHSPFLQFTYLFSQKIFVFIDEGHIFLEHNDQTIGLTYGFSQNWNSKYVLKNSSSLNTRKNLISYDISPPILNLSKIQNAENIYSFQAPEKITSDAEKILSINEEELLNLIQDDKKSDTQNIELAKNYVQDNILLSQKCANDLFLDNFHPTFSVFEGILYENPFILCRKLVFRSENDLPFHVYQKKFLNQLEKIFEYNIIFTLMSTLDHENLIYFYLKEFRRHQKNGTLTEKVIVELLNSQNVKFIKKLQVFFNKATIDSNNVEQDAHHFENLMSVIEKLWPTYCEILKNMKYVLEKHSIEDPQIAFLMKLMTSSVHEIITAYPLYEGQKITDLETFRKKALSLLLDKESKGELSDDFLEKYKQELQEASLDVLKNTNNLPDIFFEKTENSDSDSDSEEESSKIEKKQPKERMIQCSLPPFSTNLNIFNIWCIHLLTKMQNPTILASATFNDRHLQFVQKSFVEKVNCVEQVENNRIKEKFCFFFFP